MTDIVLEPIAAAGRAAARRKLLLTLKYVPPGNPFQPQAMACGEIHERNVIEAVLHRLGFPKHHHEEEEVIESHRRGSDDARLERRSRARA